jgi:hypothetical protein
MSRSPDAPVVARCLACRSEFTEEQIKGANACPACNNPGVPMDPRRDAEITINPHELRILTIWASNWAEEKCDDSARRSLKGILGALRQQLPGVSLTMLDELKDVAAAGHDVQMIKGGEVVVDLKGRKPQ